MSHAKKTETVATISYQLTMTMFSKQLIKMKEWLARGPNKTVFCDEFKG